MKKIKFGKEFKPPVYLALGMFDCVHIAHTQIIDKVCKSAKEQNFLSAVFTFSNNFSKFFKEDEKLIYTFSERLERFCEQNLDLVIYKRATCRFLKLPPEKFLNKLIKVYNIKGIVCGNDYTFGKGALGGVDLLKDFCAQNDIELNVIDTVLDNNLKVGTSGIKKLILSGNIEKANSLLGSPYFVNGKVIKGRGRGKSFLFPTANILLNAQKLKVQNGVYFTKTQIGNKVYNSVTNCGARPSVDDKTNLMETHILNFDGDLYKREIRVYFYKKIRDIQKFENLSDLKNQIEKDINFVNGIKN